MCISPNVFAQLFDSETLSSLVTAKGGQTFIIPQIYFIHGHLMNTSKNVHINTPVLVLILVYTNS